MDVHDQHCPRCGATDCKLSDRGLLRFLAVLILLRPVRCRRCRYRFWRFAPRVGGGVRGRRSPTR